MGCTNCGCSTNYHVAIGGGEYHCIKCGRHCLLAFHSGTSHCFICKEKERERERERQRQIEREKERQRQIEREKERQRQIERERNEREEEEAKKKIRSLLNSISSKINSISLSDFKFNTSIVNEKSFNLKYEKVGNLYCSMNTVSSTYSESIDTSLKRERINEQKDNYLYTETDEMSLENLRSLKIGREKARFTKRF